MYCELNRAFHQLIHDMAQSPFVDARQNSNFDMSDFFINQAGGFNHFMADTAREHDEIIEAIASKSPARPRGLAESHLGAVASTEAHTSELQSLTRISYAVFCLK